MATQSSNPDPEDGIYPYRPSHVLPVVFSVLVGASLLLHIYQNFRYRFWKIAFFMIWAGTIFTTGWITRSVSSYDPSNLNLYIVQTVLIYCGPPIYSATEYNILGRLMHYLPMHAPLHPDRVTFFFIYLGALVEGLTAAGASLLASSHGETSVYQTGSTLISVSLVLQGAVECLFMGTVALMHHRCARAGMLARNVRTLCLMLYGTSTLVLLRCVFRAVQAFSTTSLSACGATCQATVRHEWYLYAFEAAPMVLYTYWLNLVHPGRFLPRQRNRYLDLDGRTERLGPGWTDRRSKWETFADPFDLAGLVKGQPSYEKFWLRAETWPVTDDGSFALASATNVVARKSLGVAREDRKVTVTH